GERSPRNDGGQGRSLRPRPGGRPVRPGLPRLGPGPGARDPRAGGGAPPRNCNGRRGGGSAGPLDPGAPVRAGPGQPELAGVAAGGPGRGPGPLAGSRAAGTGTTQRQATGGSGEPG